MNKIWKSEKKISKCSDCPECYEHSSTSGLEAFTHNCKTNHLEYECMASDISLGFLDWKNGKWEGSFIDSIPEFCPLESKK